MLGLRAAIWRVCLAASDFNCRAWHGWVECLETVDVNATLEEVSAENIVGTLEVFLGGRDGIHKTHISSLQNFVDGRHDL